MVQEKKLTLPEALVYVLCHEQRTEIALLTWITGIVPDEGCSVSCAVVDDDGVNYPLAVRVQRSGMSYNVLFKIKNAKLGDALIAELQLRILVG